MFDNEKDRDLEQPTITTNISNETIAARGLRSAFMIVGPQRQKRHKLMLVDVLHRTDDAFVTDEAAKHVAKEGAQARCETIADASGLPWCITEFMGSQKAANAYCGSLKAAGYECVVMDRAGELFPPAA